MNQEQERLEKMGVISEVEYLDRASLTVYVRKKKNKKIRELAEFSTAIKRLPERQSIPFTFTEGNFFKINGGKMFSKLDLSDAYHQWVKNAKN